MAEREPRVFYDRVHFDENAHKNQARFRLTNDNVNNVLGAVGPFIEHATDRNNALTAEQQVRLSLRYLASGSLYSAVGDAHGVSKATISRTLHRFVDAVDQHLFRQIVNFDEDPRAMGSVVNQFHDVSDMPCVISCVDGTHIKIKKPQNDEYQFVNRHGNHSINMMAMCDRRLKFQYASARWPGAVNDARVWRNSAIGRDMAARLWNPYPNAIILGDSGYANLRYLITPLLNPQTPQQRRFNIAHKKTRRLIECAFGVLKQRFRCLLTVMPFEEVFCARVINFCLTLHNICIGPDDMDFDEIDEVNEVEEDDDLDERRAGIARRNQLVALFLMIEKNYLIYNVGEKCIK